jgi:hypothetical protein
MYSGGCKCGIHRELGLERMARLFNDVSKGGEAEASQQEPELATAACAGPLPAPVGGHSSVHYGGSHPSYRCRVGQTQ